MGEFADDVNARLRDALAGQCRGEWNTEHRVAGTPVDVVGVLDGRTVCVELEWRRADPADNTAKLFRHLSEGALGGEVVVCQVFSRYYDLAAGGVSSKRKNAEFVGGVAERALGGFEYHAVEFDLDPPKRGAGRPDGWRDLTDDAADRIAALL